LISGRNAAGRLQWQQRFAGGIVFGGAAAAFGVRALGFLKQLAEVPGANPMRERADGAARRLRFAPRADGDAEREIHLSSVSVHQSNT
jgi:hypothetical protein